MTPAYCQTCGSDGPCKHRRTSRVNALLEMFGFSQTHAPAARPDPAPEEPSAPPPPSVPATPTRSTTVLVQELWAADDTDTTPFPPPVSPTLRPVTRTGRLMRLLAGLVLLAAAGFGSYLGVEWWLSTRHDAIVNEAVTTLDTARGHAADIPAAVAALADPEADPVALSDASVALGTLDGDALALLALAEPPEMPLGGRITIEDPLGSQRVGYRALAEQASRLSADLAPILTARLAIERLPLLPDLPAGADPATIDTTATALAQVITDLDAVTALLAEPLRPPVETAIGELEVGVARYVAALRIASPSAEDEAAALVDIMATMRTDLTQTVTGRAQAAIGDVSGYVASISAAG